MEFRWMGKLGLFVLLCLAVAEGQKPANHSDISVMLLNKAGLSQAVVREAEREASRIFHAAGVEISWNECSTTHQCHHVPELHEFVVSIVGDGKGCSAGAYGVAFLDPAGLGKYADVFYRRIEREVQVNDENPGRLMGAVVAHELGHLVMGSNLHSVTGIMLAAWGEKTMRTVEMGGLLFTDPEVALIRAKTLTGRGIWRTTEFTLVQNLSPKP